MSDSDDETGGDGGASGATGDVEDRDEEGEVVAPPQDDAAGRA